MEFTRWRASRISARCRGPLMPIVPLYQNPAKDGGPLGWLNCNTTCTAMLIRFEDPSKHPSGGDVRACTRNADGRPDTKGGTNPSQNVDAAQRCWGVQLDQKVLPFETVWTLGKRDDVAFSISISYAVISGTAFDGSPGFRGNHQVVYSGGKVYDPLADGRRPGIPRGPQAWPKALLMRAAGKYAGTGEGRAAVIQANAPAIQPSKWSVLFKPGAFFVYYRNGVRTRDPGFSKNTSAPCSAPFTIPWGKGRKRVVTVTDGRLNGLMVEPTATHLALKESK